MFTSKNQLIRRTGPDRTNRCEFLRQLIIEFNTTKFLDAKEQTLANLANFAYDPINFQYLKDLHGIDVFLAQLSQNNENFIKFALAGLCNISPDPESRQYIIGLNGIKLISNYLLHKCEEIAINAVTTLFYLHTPETSHYFPPEIIKKIQIYATSTKPRYRNLGKIFMEKINNVHENC